MIEYTTVTTRNKKRLRGGGPGAPVAMAPRPWWDVVTMINVPSQSGHWQDECYWLPEQWARDPLPTPMPPGMQGSSNLGPWNSDAPPAIVTRVDQRAIPICLDCLRHERGSYAALVETLCKLDPAHLWDDLYKITGRFKPEDHTGHDVLAYRIGQVRGTRSGPDIQWLLEWLKPGLGGPVARFKVSRRASNPRLHETLHLLVRGSIDELDKQEVDRTSRPRRHGSRLNESEHAGREPDVLQESLGTTLTRAVVKGTLVRKGKHVFKVEVEGGMNLLTSYLKAVLPARAAAYKLDVPMCNDADRLRFQQEAVTTYLDCLVVQVYLGLLAHRDPEWEQARAAMVDHNSTSPPLEALKILPISEAARQTIIGDVLLLQYEARREAKLPSNTESLAALFAALTATGYSRLAHTAAFEARAKLERILNYIAFDLQRVVVTHVDWGPLLRALAPMFTDRSK
ncbi:MAG: hypothetical protein JWM80_3292 [Cyanobacteria bacterium RYN_339]|nr:hypothetical protein [Cyanobacteria bacterium RYN_339]